MKRLHIALLLALLILALVLALAPRVNLMHRRTPTPVPANGFIGEWSPWPI